jgi:hypothetical protein
MNISAALIREINRLKVEVAGLEIYSLTSNPRIRIQYQGLLTMLDGKALNAVTGNRNSQACPICHCRPVEMCMAQGCPFTPKEGALDYGCAPLHFGLRTFEFFLNIGYRQDFKSWQARGDTNKAKMARRKSQMHAELKDEIGIIVGQVRQGSGTSNTGNCARRGFRSPEIFARVCGVPVEMVKLIRTIWILIATPFAVDPDKFKVHKTTSIKKVLYFLAGGTYCYLGYLTLF